MKRDEIQPLLAEYLEGSLPAGEMARVKEHLRTCADCRDELQFLKKYMKKIETFPSLKAPDDFLDSIRRRIDEPERGSLVKKLFFPMKIKIPLEAAALIALAVTGLLVFRPFSSGVIEYKSEEPGGHAAREYKTSPREDTVASRDEKSAVMDRMREGRKATDRKVAATRAEETVTSKVNEPEQLEKEKVAVARGEQAEITLYLKQNTIPGAEPSMDDSFKTRSMDAEETRIASRKSAGAAKKDKAASGASMPSVAAGNQSSIDDLANLAQSLDGRIIKKARDGKEGYSAQVVVEIPRKNYSRFMKVVRSNWSVQKQYPAELPKRASKVQLKLNLQN
jgi:hypothetical protein